MSLDPAIIGVVVGGINTAIIVFGGGLFMGKVTGRLDAHDADTKRIELDLREVKALLISSAVEADRLRRAEADIENIEEDVRNLRRGVGYIKDTDARTVDREY